MQPIGGHTKTKIDRFDRDTPLALINFSRDGGEEGAALEYAEQLAQIAHRTAD